MAKATNRGTCQWCHSVQKLPNGHLSIHGYTVDFGFFNGTCPGSHHLPYEQSTDLIEESIRRAEAHSKVLSETIEKTKKIDVSGNMGMHNMYRLDLCTRARGSVYVWTPGEFSKHENGCVMFRENGKENFKSLRSYGCIEDHVKSGQDGYIRHLQRQIKELDCYIERQRAAIKDWKPAPLLPL